MNSTSLPLVATRIAAALVACLAFPALAHEYWLAPSAYRAAAGDTLSVRAYVGTGFCGEPKPYAATRARVLDLRTDHVTDLRQVALNGGDDYARFVAPDAGGASISFESTFAIIQMPADEFDAYLKLEGLLGPLQARADKGLSVGPGRERYARCCRTWIAGRDLSRALQPVGLTFEVFPLADPAHGSTVPFRVLLRGKPLAGALVRAWRRPLLNDATPFLASVRDSVPARFQARTRADGSVRVPVNAPGEWMISCVHMEPTDNSREADWQSYWANFTFARTEPSAR